MSPKKFKNENPFDLLAELICRLKSLDEKQFYDSSGRGTMREPDEMEQDTKGFIQTLPYICCEDRLIRDGVPAEEKERIFAWEHSGSFSYMLCFLRQYARRFPLAKVLNSSYFHSITHTGDGRPAEFFSLNTNAERTNIILLPKIKTIHDPLDPFDETEKHWAADHVQGIQDELFDLFYIERDKLRINGKDYRVLHSFLSRHIFPENKKALKVAMCPLGHVEIPLELYTRDGPSGPQNFFSVGIKDKQYVYDRCVASILRAAEEKADIVIFPEALGCEALFSEEFYDDLAHKAREREVSLPGLILLPTWWHSNKNELYVLDAGGRCLCVQQKQFSYVYLGKDGLKYYEDLIAPEQTIHLVHIPDVGRFVFPICRDLLDPDYIQIMLRHLRATFLVCPSYTEHKTQFDLTAPGAIPYGCYTLWCNACIKDQNGSLPEYLGLAAGPQDPTVPAADLLAPECRGDCAGAQDVCMFLVEIAMDCSSVITHGHIHP